MRKVFRSVANIAVILGVVWAANAQAAEPTNVSQAREIALAAGDDLDAGHFQDALDKVSKAEALYHAPTHMVIRAEALEGLGRLVEALDTYESVAAEPLSPTAPAAFRQAREDGRQRQIALIARVPSLLVFVSGAESVDVVASLDGNIIKLAADEAIRCDPGKHLLRVVAKGYRTMEQTVELAEKGGVVKLNMQLEKEVPQGDEPPPLPPPPPVPKRTLFVPTIVAGGIGVASVAIGAVTGAMSLTLASDLKEQCAADGRCPPSARADIRRGQTLGNISTATFAVGGAALGASVVLLILGKPKERSTGMFPQAIPWIAPGMIGVRGTF